MRQTNLDIKGVLSVINCGVCPDAGVSLTVFGAREMAGLFEEGCQEAEGYLVRYLFCGDEEAARVVFKALFKAKKLAPQTEAALATFQANRGEEYVDAVIMDVVLARSSEKK